MKLGLNIPNFGPTATPAILRGWVRFAEDHGYALAMLSDHRGRPVSRAEILRDVWGTTYEGGSNVVDVVVGTLRRKLGPEAARVETARGVGYRLT